MPPLNGVVPPSGKVIGLGAVVGGEHDDRVVELAHVLELLEHIADVVIHLLHAGLVEAPVLAAGFADHGRVLVIQHGRDVHARRVVPDEERLARLLRIVAIDEVDDLGRDFLVDTLRSLERQRALVDALLSPGCTIGLARQDGARRRQANGAVFGSTAPGTSGRPGIGVFLHGGATVCWVGVLLMSGKLTPCIASR